MDLNYLRRLIRILDESTVSELELKTDEFTIKLNKNASSAPVMMPRPVQYSEQNVQPTTIPVAFNTEKIEDDNDPIGDFYEIKSPIVGTFYMAPAPEAPNFVAVGDKVVPGKTLCIIEAMKLMNEIECDVTGVIAKILVPNGTPVEFNQPLFLVKKD